MMDQPTPKPKDLFRKIKHIAYLMSQPPGRHEEATLEGFLQYARFEICEARGIPFYAKIWDEYSDEQILTEYFALRFSKDEGYRKHYEAETGTPIEDDVSWMFDKIVENRKEMGYVDPSGKPQDVQPAEAPAEEFDDTPESFLKDLEDDGILD